MLAIYGAVQYIETMKRGVMILSYLTGTEGSRQMTNFVESFQKLSKDNMDAAIANINVVSNTLQSIATETADYSKKSLEESTVAIEKIMAVKSFDKAIELQSEFAKNTYEGFIGQATKIGELYTNMAKEVYKPFEQAVSKATN